MLTNVRSRRWIRSCAALAAATCSLGLAACGSSKPSGTDADPATLAPASSALYIGAVVRPEGALRQNALADAQALSHMREPFGPLLQALAGSSPLGHVDYGREVKPWLGISAGVFATAPSALAGAAQALAQSLGSGFSPQALLRAGGAALLGAKGAPAALVLDTSDLRRARAFLARLARAQGAHQTAYRGVAFDADAQGQAEGIVGKFAVFGDEAGLKAAIDAHLGAASLKAATPYASLAVKGPAGALAAVYLNPAAAGAAAAQAGSILQALPGEPQQARIAIVPQRSAIAVDADLLGSARASESQAASAANAAASLVGSLPGGSWLALGAGESGRHAARYLTLLSSLASFESRSLLASFGGPALQALLGRLAAHGQALQRLFAGWAGPAAAFAAGSGLLSIQAGLEIESSSTTAARAAVPRLGAMLAGAGASVSSASVPGAEAALAVRVPGVPVTLDIGAGGGRFVIGLGPESVQGALAPNGTLSGAGAYSTATATLGGIKPTVLVEFPMALALLEGLGLSESPTLAPTLSSLRSLGTLAGGLQPLGGGVTRLHLVLGLTGSSSGAGEG